MELNTSRFGLLEIDAQSILHFPCGILGMEECRRWVLLADEQNEALAWLQSAERSDLALAVVSPRRFVPTYQMRVARRELAALELDDIRTAEVLAIVGKTGGAMTLNLRAPLLINPKRRLGRQVITNGNQPIQYLLGSRRTALRRSA